MCARMLASYQTQDLEPPPEMERQYREMSEALAPYVDIFLAETLSTCQEAVAAAAATASLGALCVHWGPEALAPFVDLHLAETLPHLNIAGAAPTTASLRVFWCVG